MPTVDVVSRLNFAELDNAINNTQKAIANRFDFRGATAEITLDKKEKVLKVVAEDGTKMNGISDMFVAAVHKRGLEAKAFHWGENSATALGKLKCEVKIKDGIEQDLAKSMVKIIKETKLKVQASIQGDELRLSGKQIDDLRAAMKTLEAADLGIPLQYVNMKS